MESARNLVHYVALRSRDLRPLQADLAAMGLSSLGRFESVVLDSLHAVADAILDGILAAYYRNEGRNQPTLRIYDVGDRAAEWLETQGDRGEIVPGDILGRQSVVCSPRLPVRPEALFRNVFNAPF